MTNKALVTAAEAIFPGWTVYHRLGPGRLVLYWEVGGDSEIELNADNGFGYDRLEALAGLTKSKRITVGFDDSRGMGSEWTGPYGSLDLVITAALDE